MEQFGGLPPDAHYQGSHTEYLVHQNRSGGFVSREPILTNVYYGRLINGMPVSGDFDQINLELGENGELLNIYKSWSNLTYVGDVPIIPASKALIKLQVGDIISSLNSDSNDVFINDITPGYRESDAEGSITEPIWFFIGETGSGNVAVFQVYARQFANFTASPTSGRSPLNVTFTDTSDVLPVRWLWHFGDGTNTTVQNPVHIYATPGTYNVTMNAWNDLGSDTIEKTGYITVNPKIPPIANFTASPTTGTAPLSVTFNDTSANAPASWFWTFGDSTNATVRNPVHTYTTAGIYTVSLNVTNDDGADSMTRTNYITVFTKPPTTQPTTTATTTVTTTTTTKPTPTKTHAPLSPVLALGGIVLVGFIYTIRQKKFRQ